MGKMGQLFLEQREAGLDMDESEYYYECYLQEQQEQWALHQQEERNQFLLTIKNKKDEQREENKVGVIS
jgi:hypothetical protein